MKQGAKHSFSEERDKRLNSPEAVERVGIEPGFFIWWGLVRLIKLFPTLKTREQKKEVDH